MSDQFKKVTILVTGSNGQLGSELKIVSTYESFRFIFTDIDELNLTDGVEVNSFFNTHKIDFCINCAAYTAVDKAEQNMEAARAINVDAVQNLAEACTIHNTFLIHVSTDFVFDGTSSIPLIESIKPNPINVYGITKLDGEHIALKTNPRSLIIRTSWLYSSFGNNFVKTMIRLGKEKKEFGVVNDQIGTPTYAGDLAKAIIDIIKKSDSIDLSEDCDLFHFSNEGVASWYDFAQAIFEIRSSSVIVKPLKTSEFPTPAKRPRYSVMDKTKIKNTFNLDIPYWRDSLSLCLDLIDD